MKPDTELTNRGESAHPSNKQSTLFTENIPRGVPPPIESPPPGADESPPKLKLRATPAADLPGFRDHVRSRRASLAGFLEQGALLAFENHTLTVFPRNDIYVRYLTENRQVLGELATEFFGCAVKVELAGTVPTGDTR